MKIERLILIAFLGNYLINNIVGAIVSLFPQQNPLPVSPYQDFHYYVYIVLAAILVALLAKWFMRGMSQSAGIKNGLWFGLGGFVIAIVTAFVSGVSGVILQSGKLQAVIDVLPNFGKYIINPSTLVLLGYWVIPAVAIGWWIQRSSHVAVASGHAPGERVV